MASLHHIRAFQDRFFSFSGLQFLKFCLITKKGIPNGAVALLLTMFVPFNQ